MLSQSTVSIPKANVEGKRPLLGRSTRIHPEAIREDISALIEAIDTGQLDEGQHALLRSYIYAHYHPELSIRVRVRIYLAVKEALEDENLGRMKNLAGIRQKSPYINAISNVGKRSSYFGGLIGVTVAGHFFLPPFVKFGVLPVARKAIRKLVPKLVHLTPIDKSLRLSSLVGKNPNCIYRGIRRAMGTRINRAGKPVSSDADTAPMDDLIGNLFFRALIERSSFSTTAREDFAARAQIAFLYDMARVSRLLEGLARNPDLTWERVSRYASFAMFLKSMESDEVPVQEMLRDGLDTISRAQYGKRRNEIRFYLEFERGMRHLQYLLQVVEPLDRFNERDAFDELESEEAKLAFFEQTRIVMESLYFGHDRELAAMKPMFLSFKKAALEEMPKGARTEEARYRVFQSRVKSILALYRKSFRDLGTAELLSYDQELARFLGR